MSKITIRNEKMKSLFAGVGFHNSEATMTALMSSSFKNERVLKTFREISPTFSRVFAGYANWTKEAMDAFADYYDETFRNSGTLLYLVPGRMPYITEDFDIDDYCERVAVNLEYLIKERNCTKIRYYCVTNELSVGNTYAYLSNHLDLFKTLHEKLYLAFRRHDLDIGLMATDCSGVEKFNQVQWAADNIDEITETYCVHLYSHKTPGDLDSYQYYVDAFHPLVVIANSKEKRVALGEFGQGMSGAPKHYPMGNDRCLAENAPELEALHAIGICEEAMAAINVGFLSAVLWTLFDYPDPFIRENGDTPEEKARYDACRFSGHGLSFRYNKWGLVRWSDFDKDYSARAGLYTMGYMAKLFRKGTRVFPCSWDDQHLRCCSVVDDNGNISVAIINWSDEAQEIGLEFEGVKPPKTFRKYEYCANNVPHNKFNDLQPCSGTVDLTEGAGRVALREKSVTFLTTDYVDRTPSAIQDLAVSDGLLTWKKCEDAEHRYYRVYASDEKEFPICYENQIASTVAESYRPDRSYAHYAVVSVDAYGNVGER